VIIDPLAMPVGAVSSAIVTFLKLVRRIREELDVNMICGASNVSFGLPNRPVLGAAFLSMAIGAGLTCAITNPLESEIRKAILASDVMLNHDEIPGLMPAMDNWIYSANSTMRFRRDGDKWTTKGVRLGSDWDMQDDAQCD
jgi:cobalamin-dependent methionine synthase I